MRMTLFSKEMLRNSRKATIDTQEMISVGMLYMMRSAFLANLRLNSKRRFKKITETMA